MKKRQPALSSAQMEYLVRLHRAGGFVGPPSGSNTPTVTALEKLGLVEVLKSKVRLTRRGWDVAAEVAA